MPLHRMNDRLRQEVAVIETAGTGKGRELVVTDVIRAGGSRGPRYKLADFGDRQFLRMNSNSYLGLAFREELIHAEEKAARKFGVGPGAVRFISGTYETHSRLEKELASFHRREACMLTSSAYTSMLGLLVSLVTPEMGIISDELNHNCIINGVRLAKPKVKKVYPHRNLKVLEELIRSCIGQVSGLVVITDGIFSMRGAVAPLAEIAAIVGRFDDKFPDNIVLVVDDSHGVGAFGKTGRGTEEYCNASGIDVLVGTLGKAFGVNGGYIVSSQSVIAYLREKNPLYIYTNPITPPEAAAALCALELLESAAGGQLLAHLRTMTTRFESGLVRLGYETIESEHPIVPLFVRDTEQTAKLVKFLFGHDILATGLNFPIVPKGDQLVRFQVSADHTSEDIDIVLGVLAEFKKSN